MPTPNIADYRFDIDDRYAVTFDIPLRGLSDTFTKYQNEDNLDLSPDFQRGHVWTTDQQIAYCEFVLKGGKTNPLLFNHPGWFTDFEGDMVIVDGLQRFTALSLMMQDSIEVFGYKLSDFEDVIRFTRSVSISFKIHALKTRADVLKWYLQVNSTGTPHDRSEIDRVKRLLDLEGI